MDAEEPHDRPGSANSSAAQRAWPVPVDDAPYVVVVPAPAPGPGNWVGAPSAVVDEDGGFVIAYRLRTAQERGGAVHIARSADGETVTPLVTLDKDRFGAESLERPALVRTDTGAWRLYVSCATPGSKHWRIDVLESVDLAGLQTAGHRTAFPGDELTGVKDPVIRRIHGAWGAWVCCHPLEEPGEEDRMITRYATSPDGLEWQWQETVLTGRPGTWDARGARVTAILPDGSATYDGRASKEQNFAEHTGRARARGCRLLPLDEGPVSSARYLDVVALGTTDHRLYYEAPLPDGSHELRTQRVQLHGGED
jgi:hypothetical protein